MAIVCGVNNTGYEEFRTFYSVQLSEPYFMVTNQVSKRFTAPLLSCDLNQGEVYSFHTSCGEMKGGLRLGSIKSKSSFEIMACAASDQTKGMTC